MLIQFFGYDKWLTTSKEEPSALQLGDIISSGNQPGPRLD
jgi:hypothetical protein